jgi:hypothetical protein
MAGEVIPSKLEIHELPAEKERAEDELKMLRQQQKDLDDEIHGLTQFFFAVNAALLGLLSQIIGKDTMFFAMVAAFYVGYTASVAIFLISLKGYLNWDINQVRVAELEEMLGYKIWKSYTERKGQNPLANLIGIAKVRVVFNGAFAALWIAALLVTRSQFYVAADWVVVTDLAGPWLMFLAISALWRWWESRNPMPSSMKLLLTV